MWISTRNRDDNYNRHFDMDNYIIICNSSEYHSIKWKIKTLEENKQKILLNFLQIGLGLIKYLIKNGYLWYENHISNIYLLDKFLV